MLPVATFAILSIGFMIMATNRTRIKSGREFMIPDTSWMSSRVERTRKSISGILFKVLRGAAVDLAPTRALSSSRTTTMSDQIGRPDASSLSRFFPTKRPYRPLLITGTCDYSGTGGDPDAGIPPASPAHTFTEWMLNSNLASTKNYQYLDNLTNVGGHGNAGSIARIGSDIQLIYKGVNHEHLYATPTQALAAAPTIAAQLFPNLIETGWVLTSEFRCLARSSGYQAMPEVKVKSLSSGEQAELLDARRRAYESMIHQAGKTQLNCLRSVLELKDVPGTLTGLGLFLKTVSAVQLLTKSRTLSASFDASSLTLGQLAAIHLWYQFGVKPSVSDVKSWCVQIQGTPLASLIASDKSLLMAGQTVRSAYAIDHRKWERALPNTLVSELQNYSETISYVNGMSNYEVCTHAFYAYAPLVSLPEGNFWKHSGVLFSRALKPDWKNMPDWAHDLLLELNSSAFEGESLIRPNRDELALYFNPPLLSLWKVAGYSWLADWAWNASSVLERIERLSSRAVCSFEEMWACDRWEWRPLRWSLIPIFDKPEVTYPRQVLSYAANQYASIFDPKMGTRYAPVVRFINANASPSAALIKLKARYTYVLQTPPTSSWMNVSRGQIPLPPVRIPSFFDVELDAWKIGILSALSITRLRSMSAALRTAKWSIARYASMWRQPGHVDLAKLALCVAGVISAKEFTYD